MHDTCCRLQLRAWRALKLLGWHAIGPWASTTEKAVLYRENTKTLDFNFLEIFNLSLVQRHMQNILQEISWLTLSAELVSKPFILAVTETTASAAEESGRHKAMRSPPGPLSFKSHTSTKPPDRQKDRRPRRNRGRLGQWNHQGIFHLLQSPR